MLILDDGQGPGLAAANGFVWRALTDRVMGGLSDARLTRGLRLGRQALVLQGDVRLDNNGGFVQMALDLAPEGAALDASLFRALQLVVQGNGARYNVHCAPAR